MPIRRLAHVCLNVRSLDASLAFYGRLGLKPVFTFTRKGRVFGAYLDAGEGSFLELFEEPGRGEVVNNGLAHFCLETADLAGLEAELAAAGVRHTPRKRGCDATWQIWLEDPDGNRFEVHQYTAESSQFQGGSVEADW